MIADCSTPITPAVTPDEIVREVKQLPSAPKVLPRLKQLLSDGNSAMQDIVALIRLDPGIVARVLQVANSAYFSKGARCLTVEEAVHRVGFNQIYELVAYAVASQVLIRPLTVYGIEADLMWKRSVACGLAAETLAVRIGQDRAVAYTIGLLHSVGMVAIDEWALRQARTLTLPSAGLPREAAEAERAKFGFTQAEVGATLLRHWDFPRSISEPVRWQYAPRASAGHVQMASLLYAAKWLRSAVCDGNKNRMAPPEVTQLQPISLTPTALQGMVGEIETQLTAVSSLLAIEDRKAAETDRHLFPAQHTHDPVASAAK